MRLKLIRKNVKYHIECLRIIAILFVIFNHTGTKGYFLFSIREESSFYWLYLFVSILCKIAVPIFYMISGALLLNREESNKDLYQKRILRFIVVILLFSFIQYVYTVFTKDTSFNLMVFFGTVYSNKMATAYGYLYTYLGLLVMLPFLRKLACAMDKKDYLYLFRCQFIIVSVLPILQYLFGKGDYNLFSGFTVPIITTNSIFYFLMGHFLENILDEEDYNFKGIIFLLLSSVVAILISCYLTYYRAQIMGICTESDSQLFHNTLISIPTFATYYCAKYYFNKFQMKDSIKMLITYLGSLTFGVMLIENILREELEFVFNKLYPYLGSLLSCGIYIIIIFLYGAIITAILKLIPGVKKLI